MQKTIPNRDKNDLLFMKPHKTMCLSFFLGGKNAATCFKSAI